MARIIIFPTTKGGRHESQRPVDIEVSRSQSSPFVDEEVSVAMQDEVLGAALFLYLLGPVLPWVKTRP